MATRENWRCVIRTGLSKELHTHIANCLLRTFTRMAQRPLQFRNTEFISSRAPNCSSAIPCTRKWCPPSLKMLSQKFKFLRRQLRFFQHITRSPLLYESHRFSLLKYLFSFPLPQSHCRGHQLISVATLQLSLSCLALLPRSYLLKVFRIVFYVNGDPWLCDTGAWNHPPLGWSPPNTDVIHSCLQFLNDSPWPIWVLFKLSPEESDGGEWRV